MVQIQSARLAVTKDADRSPLALALPPDASRTTHPMPSGLSIEKTHRLFRLQFPYHLVFWQNVTFLSLYPVGINWGTKISSEFTSPELIAWVRRCPPVRVSYRFCRKPEGCRMAISKRHDRETSPPKVVPDALRIIPATIRVPYPIPLNYFLGCPQGNFRCFYRFPVI